MFWHILAARLAFIVIFEVRSFLIKICAYICIFFRSIHLYSIFITVVHYITKIRYRYSQEHFIYRVIILEKVILYDFDS